jgi:hypothetical protein
MVSVNTFIRKPGLDFQLWNFHFILTTYPKDQRNFTGLKTADICNTNIEVMKVNYPVLLSVLNGRGKRSVLLPVPNDL